MALTCIVFDMQGTLEGDLIDRYIPLLYNRCHLESLSRSEEPLACLIEQGRTRRKNRG